MGILGIFIATYSAVIVVAWYGTGLWGLYKVLNEMGYPPPLRSQSPFGNMWDGATQ